MTKRFAGIFKIVIVISMLFYAAVIDAAARAGALDLSKSVIVCSESAAEVAAKAVDVLLEEIEKRTRLRLAVRHDWPDVDDPVILVCTENSLNDLAGEKSHGLDQLDVPGPEGYRLSVKNDEQAVLFIVGKDPRGLLYAVGGFLRNMRWTAGHVAIPADLQVSTTPKYKIRGHQLGYRPKTNAYDAWDVEQFEQYIRELVLFGANSIEIMPPRTDDDLTSDHMPLPPMQMMLQQAEIIDAYGMDVWMWYPNMGENYTDPDSIRKELQERDEIFKRLKRVDVVFVPGGDPGDLHPELLFVWLHKVAAVLNRYHPQAEIWVSPQAFRPTSKWLDAFYENVNKKYPWFGGVVFGPWVKTTLPDMRRLVREDIPIRRYPDITHSISSQYPVRDWDLAFSMTLGRECYNPRPLAEKTIHNALDEYADGSISYSEGINDDVNKFIWSVLDWQPETSPLDILREYSRLFISSDLSEALAVGILALEKNWQGPLLANEQVDVTLMQWQDLEKTVPAAVKGNYRFQMCLLRAYYDAYVRQRLLYEKQLESAAYDILRNAAETGTLPAIKRAETVLKNAWEQPVAHHYQQRCWQIADFLFREIGSQLSVQKHGAKPGRGDFMDSIDAPLNDVIWLLSRFSEIREQKDEESRLLAIAELLSRTNPGPGGFYRNLGPVQGNELLADYPAWDTDPGNLRSPRVSFGVGLRGEEWIHTVAAKGFDGRATPLAWMNQVTTLYETPLSLNFAGLDPEATYRLRVAYTGRFRARIKLTADATYPIHALLQTGEVPIMEFLIPAAATRDGKLTLTWTCGEGERGAQLAEIWLMREK
jgi:hypothetical protein